MNWPSVHMNLHVLLKLYDCNECATFMLLNDKHEALLMTIFLLLNHPYEIVCESLKCILEINWDSNEKFFSLKEKCSKVTRLSLLVTDINYLY